MTIITNDVYDIDLQSLPLKLDVSKQQEVTDLLFTMTHTPDVKAVIEKRESEEMFNFIEEGEENSETQKEKTKLDSLVKLRRFIIFHQKAIIAHLNKNRGEKLKDTIAPQDLVKEVIQYINIKLDINLDEAFEKGIEARYSDEIKAKTADTVVRVFNSRVSPRNREKTKNASNKYKRLQNLLQEIQDAIVENNIPTKTQKYLAKVLNAEKQIDVGVLHYVIKEGLPENISQIPVNLCTNLFSTIQSTDRLKEVLRYLSSVDSNEYMKYIEGKEHTYAEFINNIKIEEDQERFGYKINTIKLAHQFVGGLESVENFLTIYNNEQLYYPDIYTSIFGCDRIPCDKIIAICNNFHSNTTIKIFKSKRLYYARDDIKKLGIDRFINKLQPRLVNYFFRKKYGLEK